MKNYIFLLSLFLSLSCNDRHRLDSVPLPHGLKIPAEGMDITIVQRSSIEIAGYSSSLRIKIGDITAGQTLITIADSQMILKQSIREGSAFTFQFDGVGYVLACKRLINHLLDEDLGIFNLTKDTSINKTKVYSENDKIEKLLSLIGQSNIVFLRNGSEYKPAEAESHLRNKWDKAKEEVHNINDFIEKIGSQSSSSGLPYNVKLPDGTIMFAGAWLREQIVKVK